MKRKLPFSLEYKDDIITGLMSVVTDCGEPVEIVKWDCKGRNPILGVIDDGDTSDSCFFDNNGKSINGIETLYILWDDGEPELTEFEKTYLQLVHRLSSEDILPNFIEKNNLRDNCRELFKVAKKDVIGKVRSILNKIAYRNNGLDVNGDYCEQPYVELDNEFRKLLKEG